MKKILIQSTAILCVILMAGCSTTEFALTGGAIATGALFLDNRDKVNRKTYSQLSPTKTPRKPIYIPKPKPTPFPQTNSTKVVSHSFQNQNSIEQTKLKQGIQYYQNGKYQSAIQILQSMDRSRLSLLEKEEFYLYIIFSYKLTGSDTSANQWLIRAKEVIPNLSQSRYISD